MLLPLAHQNRHAIIGAKVVGQADNILGACLERHNHTFIRIATGKWANCPREDRGVLSEVASVPTTPSLHSIR
jgi:hypothetical protein